MQTMISTTPAESIANQPDDSFNMAFVSLPTNQNELEKVDLIFAELKKIRQQNECLVKECMDEKQDLQQKHDDEKQHILLEIELQKEALQNELEKKCDELKNISFENHTQKSVSEKMLNFLGRMMDGKLNKKFLLKIFEEDPELLLISFFVIFTEIHTMILDNNTDNDAMPEDEDEGSDEENGNQQSDDNQSNEVENQNGNNEEQIENGSETGTDNNRDEIMPDDSADSNGSNYTNDIDREISSMIVNNFNGNGSEMRTDRPQSTPITKVDLMPPPPSDFVMKQMVPIKINCYKCEESFIKESSFENHLKADHNIAMVNTSPGKFVRVEKNRSKRKRMQRNGDDDDVDEKENLMHSSRINPMKQATKKMKKNK